MRFCKYVASKCIPLCFIGLAVIFLLLFLLMQSANAAIILSMALGLALLTVLWLAASYLVQRRRYERLERVISELDEKYLLGEVLPKAQNEVEMVYYHIMKTVSRSAITAVEKAKQEKEEYREYVESWIHELKTPLTACALILENGGNTQKLRRELKRADNMTESILYYARTKSLEKDTIIRAFSVSDVIESSVKSQMALLIAAGISIEVTGDFIINSDDKALGFIINQLLINSAKYCTSCHITIAADNNIITYEDNGIGIPSHELDRITERGFTGTNGRRIGNSTGMGLYIVKELCRHLNIALSIASEENSFTSFKLTFHSLTKL